MKPLANQGVPTLAQEEYDFSSVPDNELESCLHYEYARESEAVTREVMRLKRQICKEAKRLGSKPGRITAGMKLRYNKVMGSRRGGIYEGILFSLLACSDGFPHRPWQKLSASDKQRLRDFVDHARQSDPHALRTKDYPPLVIDASSKNPTKGEITVKAWKREMMARYRQVPLSSARELFQTDNLAPAEAKSLVHGFIQINTGYSHDQILESMGAWLKKNYPEREVKSLRRPGPKGLRGAFNALGALRLRFYCGTYGVARKLMMPLREKDDGMFYEHRESFNRACKEAVHHFRRLLFLSPTHLPIHLGRTERK